VVDGQPFAVDRLKGAESHRRIFEFAAEEFKQMRVCPLREAGISDTIVAVEYHRARAFEEFAFVFVAGEVYLFFYGKAFVFDMLQYFGAAFEAAVFGKHRVQYHPSARVERHPVVWENTIGRMRRGSIAYRYHFYGILTQESDHIEEFCPCLILDLSGGCVVGFFGKGVFFRLFF